MRKTLLITTILLGTTSVWAFGGGGGGGHGRKAASYQGGLDAIGVHINGKGKADIDIIDDDDSQEGACGEGTICGDGCCYGDNICKQNSETGEYQCCNDNKCCAINETAYYVFPNHSGPPPACCAGIVFCNIYNMDGNCMSYGCCSAGSVIKADFTFSDGKTPQKCCEHADDKISIVNDTFHESECVSSQ